MAEVAKLMVAAENPLIIAGRVARTERYLVLVSLCAARCNSSIWLLVFVDFTRCLSEHAPNNNYHRFVVAQGIEIKRWQL